MSYGTFVIFWQKLEHLSGATPDLFVYCKELEKNQTKFNCGIFNYNGTSMQSSDVNNSARLHSIVSKFDSSVAVSS